MAKRGAKPLPRYEQETKHLVSRMARIGVTAETLARQFRDGGMCTTSLRLKLRGVVGWHDEEIEELGQIVTAEERKLKKLALSL
jgi:hypothetical protein